MSSPPRQDALGVRPLIPDSQPLVIANNRRVGSRGAARTSGLAARVVVREGLHREAGPELVGGLDLVLARGRVLSIRMAVVVKEYGISIRVTSCGTKTAPPRCQVHKHAITNRPSCCVALSRQRPEQPWLRHLILIRPPVVKMSNAQFGGGGGGGFRLSMQSGSR